ncbi:hypothetical protein KIH27_16010 [Mycobacterium sp. M1]|uniref:Uncharacterized protein n=1 Tax=Mycolicibacter acidiphilus TaxID=2835306 RepID=A0ABS5RLA6_9MYCO|nr:hypothetical protein [Mycolicibacter acidiphilus]MBS9535093.1 hypothetical protein [Mycolicibacter acidiphilus]
MKVPDSRAAAARYEITEDRFGCYPAVPDDLGPIHAVLLDATKSPWRRKERRKYTKAHEELFLEFFPEEAACGRNVRLIFPLSFDTGEDDACAECLEMVELWTTDRDAYDRRVRERQRRRWLARERADEDEEAQRDYEEFLERQEADLHHRSNQQEHDEVG